MILTAGAAPCAYYGSQQQCQQYGTCAWFSQYSTAAQQQSTQCYLAGPYS